nr:unnamed protein product [Spirometra erinaceieuropaei]
MTKRGRGRRPGLPQRLQRQWSAPPENLRRTSPHPDQHLTPTNRGEGDLDAASVVTLAPANHIPARRPNHHDMLVRKVIPDEDSPTASQESSMQATTKEYANSEPLGGALQRHSNRSFTISDAATARLPRVETNTDFELLFSLHETIKTVQQLSSGKALGSDAIPAEICKHGGPQFMEHLTVLFQEMWRQREVPQDFKDARTVYLCKRKENRQICDNQPFPQHRRTIGTDGNPW